MNNEHNSLTSTHKMTLNKLTWCFNQSITQSEMYTCYFIVHLLPTLFTTIIIQINTHITNRLYLSYSLWIIIQFTEEILVCLTLLINILLYQSCILNTWVWVLTIFTNPSARVGYDTRSIFKRSLTGLHSEFSFSETSCLAKAEEPSLPYYLPIAGGRVIGFIPFPRVLVLCEMQSVSSRIWTRVAVYISYDDNDYTMGTSKVWVLTSSRRYGKYILPFQHSKMRLLPRI